MGLISPTAGQAQVLGADVVGDGGQVLARVGALIEGPAHYPYLTGAQNLAPVRRGRLPPPIRAPARHRVDEALDRVGLANAADKKAKAYSLG